MRLRALISREYSTQDSRRPIWVLQYFRTDEEVVVIEPFSKGETLFSRD
jgi:hypothetical protein